MKNTSVKFKRAKETSFLIVDAIIFDEFSPYALKVYGQLRKLTSFNSENDEIEITVKNLAHLSGISERKTYDVLNELEHRHFIIQRSNIYHYKYGQTNTFIVSQTYNFFKPVQISNSTAPPARPVDNCGQFLTTPARGAEGTAPRAEGTAQYAVLKKQESPQEVSKKKQNKETPVPVFADAESIKTQLQQTVSKRNVFVDDDILEEIVFYIGSERGREDVIKKINIALKLVREGKWNTPQGYNNISSQSIREQEEVIQEIKKEHWRKDATVAKSIFTVINKGEGFAAFNAMVKKLKDETNENQGRMSKTAF